MSSLKKVSLRLILLCIIIGAVAYGAVYYFWFYQEAKNSKTPDVVQTTDWKTYGNDEYGFEFKYPKEWSVAEEKNEDYFLILIGKQEPVNVYGVFGFTVRQKTEEEYLKSLKNKGFYIVDKSNTVVGNMNANFYVLKRTNTPTETQWRNIVVVKDGTVLELSMGAIGEYDSIFWEIISTFKFTK
jgi:hypothetical protein